MRRAVVSKKPGWIACGAALVFHILILSLQTNQQPGPGFLRRLLMNALTPMHKMADSGISGVSGIWDNYIALIGVRDENQKLRAEIDRLRLQLGEQEQDILESERLRKLLELTSAGVGKKIVVARVIGRDPSHSHQTITIDKGQEHGCTKDTSVIVSEGVVGRVFAAGNTSATVQLITDSQSSVAAMVRSTRVQAVFKGTGSSELELDYIDNDDEIKEGDELMTSGLDQIHPKGLSVGFVTFVGPPAPPAGILKTVRIRPSVALGRIEEVVCVLGRPARVPNPLDSPNPFPQRD
jgi:rod shape-determining protein MreC